MHCDEDCEGAPEEDETIPCDLPDTEVEVHCAKMFLQQCSSLTGDNLYDHLTDVLNKILSERPHNIVDFFEEYSRKIKEKRFKPINDRLEDVYVPPKKYELAKKLMPFLKGGEIKESSTADPEEEQLADMSRNDMLQLCYFFEQSGLGLPKKEMFILTISMMNLIKSEPITAIRFWGKIQGLYKNYYVLETELNEEEYAKRNEALEEEEAEAEVVDEPSDLNVELERIAEDQLLDEQATSKVPRKLPPAPTIHREIIPDPPPEPSGKGVNKKVYYVCNEVGDDWISLPDVTPIQIQVARQIKKSFTGLLSQEIITYPHFPGTEINYLRAQIARISAGTQISPLGFYTFKDEGFGEEEEEEEEVEPEGEEGTGSIKTSYKENKKYEPPSLRDLIDSSMSFWVHHTLYILPQGRTTWWNPQGTAGGDDEGGEEELGEEEGGKAEAGPEPETGPPLLTPLSEDASLEAIPPWSVRVSSNVLTDYALAVVRSNIWPGAYCFTNQGKIFQNIYIGYGHKYLSHNFSPVPLPFVEQEYPLGPEIMEITDPTGAEEEQWRIDHLPPPPTEELGKGEGEEEEEEDEVDEDEDY